MYHLWAENVILCPLGILTVWRELSWAGEALVVVNKVKYLGHIITDNLSDDDDVLR